MYVLSLIRCLFRWNSQAVIQLLSSQNEIIHGLKRVKTDQNELLSSQSALLSTCEKSRTDQNSVIVELLEACNKPDIASDNKTCWNDIYVPIGILDSPLAVCARDIQGRDWIVIQQRGQFGNDEQYFAKTFSEYQEGFSSQGELWVGLDKLAQLTGDHSWQLWVELTMWGNGLLQPQKLSAFYSSFKVGQGPGYQLTVAGFERTISTLGDSLRQHNGGKFSTLDKDQDGLSSGSCSQQFGRGGWWYKDCFHSNLNQQPH